MTLALVSVLNSCSPAEYGAIAEGLGQYSDSMAAAERSQNGYPSPQQQAPQPQGLPTSTYPNDGTTPYPNQTYPQPTPPVMNGGGITYNQMGQAFAPNPNTGLLERASQYDNRTLVNY